MLTPAGEPQMPEQLRNQRAVLELTVNNHPGVMSHVCSLFSRRVFNVEGILCMPIDNRKQSRIWLLVDEDQNSIDYASFDVCMLRQPTRMIDWPATYHNYAASFAFADGHSEMHKWKDGRTKKTTLRGGGRVNPLTIQGNPDSQDLLWLQQRTSALF